ncbi:hypothetical protein WN982_25230 [Paraburkholderia sp. IMGN_8]|uniref:hypothetical protein n=1 Tax=Paraburkholderia sp. IMGN_8 TaxID=3136564 RepID=UPI0031019847
MINPKDLVRCVAEQEDAAVTPRFSHDSVKAIDRNALHLDCAGIDKGREHAVDVFRIVERLWFFTGHDLDFPPPQAVRTNDIRAGSRRTAILHATLGKLDVAMQICVDHHPPFVESQCWRSQLMLAVFTGALASSVTLLA